MKENVEDKANCGHGLTHLTYSLPLIYYLNFELYWKQEM